MLALSGSTGRPLGGVAVTVLKGRWNPTGTDRIAEAVTDRAGRAVLDLPDERGWSERFIFARRGADLAVGTGTPYGWGPASGEGETTAALVFTDRSIYRPLQKVLWKALAYQGDSRAGRFRVFPGASVTVTLVDRNGQAVASRSVTTNGFGTAAGEFAIPSGRALGAWRVTTSLGGVGAGVRVEEYKRPTFEVTLKDSAEPLRLNRPARLSGEARYYFGLPVASGSVRWSITRTPSFPWWYWSRGFYSETRTETVAAGSSALQADGSFTIAFTPKADERLAGEKGTTYRYAVSADASDEGGETRSATRTFRLGFVAVEARIAFPGGFLRAAEREELTVVRTNLDGAPRAGKGSWRLVRLQQPGVPVLPAELPPDPGRPPEGAFRTPGDGLRPRWQTSYAPERVMAQWKEGAEVGRGVTTHDDKGIAKIAVAGLTAGAYRLLYATRDEFGAEYQAPRDFIVAADRTPLALCAVLLAQASSVPVGGTARLLATSGLPGQVLELELDRDGVPFERRTLVGTDSPALIEIPIGEKHRGGFAARLTMVRDHQFVTQTQTVFVPWDDKELAVSFSTFRDRLTPGQKETWTVKVERPHGGPVEPAAAELLASMYDRSLDGFAPYSPPSPLSLYPSRTQIWPSQASLGEMYFGQVRGSFPDLPGYAPLLPDRLKFPGGYAMGGPGRRNVFAMAKSAQMDAAAAPLPASAPVGRVAGNVAEAARKDERQEEGKAGADASASGPLRADFSETAFWKPQLLTGPDGSVSFEFTVPDSVTAWNVWVHAVTKDLKAGSVHRETRSVKDLMVRPYVPRFLREGDQAELKVVVNNASDRGLAGRVRLEILDTETSASALADFGLSPERATLPFSAAAGAGADVTFRLSAPRRVGSYAIEARATAGDLSDGERRPVPVLPGRMQLSQSRFAALRGGDRRTLSFADMAKGGDPSRIDEQLVVTVDGQLFYSVLSALPYLVNYPYECTEQTLNRFLSTGIVSSVFRDYPAVAAMAQELSKRDTRLETWDAADPNRRMQLEETPWLEEAKGGKPGADLTRVLDPRIAKADRDAALGKLRQAQTDSGGFPWWPGGPPSPYMTLYILSGFAHALEFGVEVPKDVALSAWRYAGADIRRDIDTCMAAKGTCEYATFVNYVLSSYPDEAWYAPAFDAAYRRTLLDYSFAHWKSHSPLLKGQLALTLERMGRPRDATTRLGFGDGRGEDGPGPRHVLRARGPVVALVQRHGRDSGFRAAGARRARTVRPASPRPRPVALPQQEAEPVEVDPRDGRGDLRARLVPEEGRRAGGARGRHGRGREPDDDLRLRAGPLHGPAQPGGRAGREDRPAPGRRDRGRENREGPGLRLRDLALLDRKAAGRGPGRLLRRLAQVLSARIDPVGFRAEAALRGRRRSARRRDRGPDLAPVETCRGVRPPARPAPRGRRARERAVPLQVGPGNLLVRGDPRLRARTSSSRRCRSANTRSSTGSARTWRAPSRCRPRPCSRCTRRSSTPIRRGRCSGSRRRGGSRRRRGPRQKGDVDADHVADEGRQRVVLPADPEIAPVEAHRRLQADQRPIVLGRRCESAREAEGQDDVPRHAVHRQRPGGFPTVARLADRTALEADLGESRGVEEAVRTQVLVPLLDPGVDRSRPDDRENVAAGRVGFRSGQRDLEVRELSGDLGKATHDRHREAHRRVAAVDLVLDRRRGCGERQEQGGEAPGAGHESSRAAKASGRMQLKRCVLALTGVPRRRRAWTAPSGRRTPTSCRRA